MLFSVIISTLLAGFAAASVECPIKPYDAKPGYQIACVYGDDKGVYENRLVKDIDVQGSMFAATLPFECIRQVGSPDSNNGGAKWLGYNLNGKLCWVTEGNVQGEDKAACFKELQPCRLRGVNNNNYPSNGNNNNYPSNGNNNKYPSNGNSNNYPSNSNNNNNNDDFDPDE